MSGSSPFLFPTSGIPTHRNVVTTQSPSRYQSYKPRIKSFFHCNFSFFHRPTSFSYRNFSFSRCNFSFSTCKKSFSYRHKSFSTRNFSFSHRLKSFPPRTNKKNRVQHPVLISSIRNYSLSFSFFGRSLNLIAVTLLYSAAFVPYTLFT